MTDAPETRSPTPSAEPPSPTRLAAYAAIGAGLGVGVSRFLFWPLGSDDLTPKIVIGASAGLVIAGGQLCKNAGDPPRRLLEIPAALAGAGLALVFAWLVLAPTTLGDVDLEQRTFPGLRIALPEGDDTVQQSDFYSGRVRVMVESRDRAIVELTWESGVGWTDLTDEEIRKLLGALMEELEIKGAVDLGERTVNGHRAVTAATLSAGTGLTVVNWYCEHDQRAITLMAATRAGPSQSKKLLDRMADSATCHTDDGSERARPLPGFDLEPVARVAGAEPPMFVSRGDTMLIAKDLPRDTVAAAADKPQLLAKLFQAIDPTFVLDPTPVQATTRSGGERTVWKGTMDADGMTLDASLATLQCTGSAYLLIALRPDVDVEGAPHDAPPELLLAARCPQDGDPEPEDARVLAERACRGGDVETCGTLIDLAVTEDEAVAWLTEACEAGVAAACEAVE